MTPVPGSPIGVFDSGIGGLSIYKEIKSLLPQEQILFVADQGNVPYGPRPLEEVRGFADAITRYFISQDAKLIVIACNAASAASLYYLRERYPQIPIVGMEPALKPASLMTRSKVIGVLATPATFQGELYPSLVDKYADGIEVIQDVCTGLVQEIEKGNLMGGRTREILEGALTSMLKAGADTIVLGCTHYPHVIPQIKSIVGDKVQVIDPSPAVARQVKHVLEEENLLNPGFRSREDCFFTSGDTDSMQRSLVALAGIQAAARKVFHREGSLFK